MLSFGFRPRRHYLAPVTEPKSHASAASDKEPKAETHVLAEPLWVVSAPSVVEEADMETIGEIGLEVGKAEGCLLTESNNWRIQRL